MQPCHKGCVLMIIKECPKIATCLSVYLSKDSGFFFSMMYVSPLRNTNLLNVISFLYQKWPFSLFHPYYLLSHSIISMMMWSLWCLSLVIWDFLSRQSSFSILNIMMVACYNAELIVLSMILVWNGIASYQFSISH